jgi:hypothetical protein
VCAGKSDHQIECILEVEVIEYEDSIDNLFGLFIVLSCDLFEGLVDGEDE